MPIDRLGDRITDFNPTEGDRLTLWVNFRERSHFNSL